MFKKFTICTLILALLFSGTFFGFLSQAKAADPVINLKVTTGSKKESTGIVTYYTPFLEISPGKLPNGLKADDVIYIMTINYPKCNRYPGGFNLVSPEQPYPTTKIIKEDVAAKCYSVDNTQNVCGRINYKIEVKKKSDNSLVGSPVTTSIDLQTGAVSTGGVLTATPSSVELTVGETKKVKISGGSAYTVRNAPDSGIATIVSWGGTSDTMSVKGVADGWTSIVIAERTTLPGQTAKMVQVNVKVGTGGTSAQPVNQIPSAVTTTGGGMCEDKCPKGAPWYAPWQIEDSIAHAVCQMQCNVIAWMANIVAYMMNCLLIPSMGLGKTFCTNFSSQVTP